MLGAGTKLQLNQRGSVGKLFNLKQWLTVPDAAQRLTIMCGEPATEADILQLGLDGHLKLSVNFTNHALAVCGEMIDGETPASEDPEWKEFPAEMLDFSMNIPDITKTPPTSSMMSLNVSNTRFVNLNGQLAVLKGVWDLPMIGSERFDVENRFQQLTNGPPVTLLKLPGALVQSPSGRTICQLQEIHPLKKYHVPTFRLPENSTLVIRTTALRAFEASIIGTTEKLDMPLHAKELDNMLKIIIGMAIDAYGYDPAAARSPIAKEIALIITSKGMPIADDTVRKYLNMAKETVLDGIPKKS
jgi:hypothetical protein